MRVSWAYPAFLMLALLLPLLWLGVRRRRGWRPRAAAFCRGAEIILIALALAGMRIERAADRVCTIFAFDLSRSVPPERRAQAVDFAQKAVATMRSADEAGVIAFGGEALVEALPQPRLDLKPLASQPNPDATDLSAAVRLAAGLYPSGSLRRLVVFTDANENRGDVLEALRAAGPSGIQIDAVGIEAPPRNEVSLVRLDLPSRVERGEPFELRAEALASAPGPATLRFFRDGAPMGREEIQLREGRNTFTITWAEEAPGFHTYDAQIESALDDQPENNRAMGLTQVAGPSRVLLVGTEDDNAHLRQALTTSQLQVISQPGLPATMTEMQGFDAVVLNNTSAERFPPAAVDEVERYVRDLGGGLVMIGGEGGFGPGGWIGTAVERALPVRMEIKSREQFPSLGLVLVIDKSGSMGSDISSTSKMEIAKRAALEAFNLLGERDFAGVVVFDSSSAWAVNLGPIAAGKADAAAKISNITAGGGTDAWQGLILAVEALERSEARLKHIILLTDGQTPQADFASLVTRMKAAKTTLSTIGIGTDADEPFLNGLAGAGGGRFYACHDAARVPRVFVRETILVQRSYIQEETRVPERGAPSPILEETVLASLPPLHGWVSTEAKERAEVALRMKGDPLLASWEFGLGHAAAFTSDATGRWSKDWAAWPGFAPFWERTIRWGLRAVPSADLHPRLVMEGGRGRLAVEAVEGDGVEHEALALHARVLGPDLQTQEVTLRQSASGRYEAPFDAAKPGAYFAAVQGDGGRNASAGGMVAFSPEFKDFQSNHYLLSELTRRTGGRLNPAPGEVFRHEGRLAEAPREIPLPLLLAAMILLLIEVALRRLSFDWSDWDWLVAWPARLNPLRLKTATIDLDLNSEQKDELVSRSREVRRELRSEEGREEIAARMAAPPTEPEQVATKPNEPVPVQPQAEVKPVIEIPTAPARSAQAPVPPPPPQRKSLWGAEPEETIDTSDAMSALVRNKKKNRDKSD